MIKMNEVFSTRTRVWVISGSLLIILYSFLSFFDEVKAGFGTLISLFMPLLIAFFLAFLLAPLNEWFSNLAILKPIKQKRYRNLIATSLTLVVMLIALTLFLLIIIPQLVTSINMLIGNLPQFAKDMDAWVLELQSRFEFETQRVNIIQQGVVWIEENFELLLRNSSTILGSVWTRLIDIIWGFILLIIFVVVFLIDRETLANSFSKLTRSLFNRTVSEELINFSRMTAEVFRNYFIGQALDSFILGVIIFVVLLIMGFPYALLISVIIMLTNMIPFFGPFLGAIPSILILLTVDVSLAIQFTIIIVIAQQIDGNILSPYILGDTLQLPSFLIMFSITIFGGLFGIMGMVFGVPTFAVLYRLVKRWMNYRLEKL